MVESGHSRIPVFDPDLDHVKGVVYARDVLVQFNNGDQIDKKISDKKTNPMRLPNKSNNRFRFETEYPVGTISLTLNFRT